MARIEKAMQVAVPQLKELTFMRDEVGLPHLNARYEHWRPTGAIHNEMDFSDGTLRLVGLVWSLLDGASLLLLEEPELSLNDGIVEQIPRILHQSQRNNKRQVLISTHSEALLKDKSIDVSDVIVLKPSSDGTGVVVPSDIDLIQLRSGLSVADVLLPKTKPDLINQMNLL